MESLAHRSNFANVDAQNGYAASIRTHLRSGLKETSLCNNSFWRLHTELKCMGCGYRFIGKVTCSPCPRCSGAEVAPVKPLGHGDVVVILGKSEFDCQDLLEGRGKR